MPNKIIKSFVIILASFFFVSACQNEKIAEEKEIASLTQQNDKYVCPMHSHILSHEEDNCPICGMQLVTNKNAQSIKKIVKSSDAYPEIKISPLIRHNLGIRTTLLERGDLTHTIETIGKITRVDPMARSRITSPITGTLHKMVDKYSGDIIKQDEFLFSVVSEDLFSMQKVYQQAYMSGDKAIASDMIPKLVLKGLDAGQIAQLQEGAEPSFPAKIYAIEDGYIFTRRGKEGDPITSSYTVFNLGGNYQVIEVTVEIFERQWDLVKEGQKVTMRLRNLPGKVFEGRVERVDEPVGYTTRALEARIKFKTNFKGLTQSTFARVIINGKTRHNILIAPRDSVIRTANGNRIVKITGNGDFQPVAIEIGEESNGMIEIKSGVKAGDRVVTSGQFLIDSESNLIADLRRMSHQGHSEHD